MLPRCCLATALLLLAAAISFAQENPPNLVDNPSLEGDLAGYTFPRGWTGAAEPTRTSYTVSVVPGGRTGEKALCIEGAGKYCAIVTNRHRIQPAKRYLVRGWVKIEGDPGAAAAVKLDFMKANGDYIDEVRMGDVPPGKEGWQCLAVAAHANDVPGAELVAVAIALNGKGKAWFDDLELVVTDPIGPDGNLIANGTMEDVAGDCPAFWFPWTDPKAQVSLTASEEDPKEGKQSLCLKGTAPYAVAIGERYRVEPGKAYSLSGFVRVKAGQASIKIDYYKGTQFLGCTEAPPVKGNAWEQRSVTSQFDKFPNATHIAPTAVAFGGNLDAYFDNLVLTAK